MQDSLAFDPSRNANAGDKLLRAQLLDAADADPSLANPTPPRGSPNVSPEAALALGWDFFEKLMTDDGHWAGDYGGPLFLTPGLVIACYAAGVDLGPRASAMLTYMRNHQQTDGGWGLHIEGPSTLFPTTMNYMAARLLGVPADDVVRLHTGDQPTNQSITHTRATAAEQSRAELHRGALRRQACTAWL